MFFPLLEVEFPLLGSERGLILDDLFIFLITFQIFQIFFKISEMKKMKLAKTLKNEGACLDFFGARSAPRKIPLLGFPEKKTLRCTMRG